MLWQNNKCNEDLGDVVENGAFQFFECPPLAFSPLNKHDEGQNVTTSYDSNNYNLQDQERILANVGTKLKRNTSLWANIANITPK